MTKTPRAIPGFSCCYIAPRGDAIDIRAMRPTDEKALLDCLRRIPPDDRQYLRDDVTSSDLVTRWATHMNYDRVLPLLAFVRDKIVADATLHRNRDAAHRHIGELRIVIDPEYRNQGLGRFLLKRLAEIAKDQDANLERVLFEVVKDGENAALHAARAIGFVDAREFPDHVAFYNGRPHHVTLLTIDLRDAVPTPLDEPAHYMY
jgi:GNAT superfamily N-acetyltransferase